MTEFTLAIKVNAKYGLNELCSGRHWGKRKKVADEIHDLVHLELKRQKIPKILYKVPVEVVLLYNSQLDCDNHGFLTKAIIDGLKKYLIEDDRRKFVKRVTQEFHSGSGVIVKVKEFENA